MNQMSSIPRQFKHSVPNTMSVPRLDTSSRDILALIASFLKRDEVAAFGRSCRAASLSLHTATAWSIGNNWNEKWNTESPWLYSSTFRVAVREMEFTLSIDRYGVSTLESGRFGIYGGCSYQKHCVDDFSGVQIRILHILLEEDKTTGYEPELADALSKLNLGALHEIALSGPISQTCIQNLAVILQPLAYKLKLRLVLAGKVGRYDYVLSSDNNELETDADDCHHHTGTDSSTSEPSSLSSSRGPTSCGISQRVDNAVFLINIGGLGPQTPLFKACDVEISVEHCKPTESNGPLLSNAISFFLNMLDATCLERLELRNTQRYRMVGIQLHLKPHLLERISALDLFYIRLLSPLSRKLPSCSTASASSSSSSSSSSTPSDCSIMFSHLNQLVRMGLEASHLSASDFKALAAIPTLEELSVNFYTHFTPEHLHALAGSPVKKLKLVISKHNPLDITGPGNILGLAGLTNLTSLKLEVPTSMFGDWSAFASLPLRELSLSSADPMERYFEDDEFIPHQPKPFQLRLPSTWRLDHLILDNTSFDLNTMYLAAIVDLPVQPRHVSFYLLNVPHKSSWQPRSDRAHAQQQRFWTRLHAQTLTIDLIRRAARHSDITSPVLGGLAWNSHLQTLGLRVRDPDQSAWMSELMEWLQLPETFPALKQLLLEFDGHKSLSQALIESMPRNRPNLVAQYVVGLSNFL